MKKKVCAAVIRRSGFTLVCSRPKATLLGDKMEFPGGKVEPGESLNECIVRELKEELNAEILPLDVIHEIDHPYPSGILNIIFIRCLLPDDSALRACEGQEFRWVRTSGLAAVDFLPADLPFARILAENAAGR